LEAFVMMAVEDRPSLDAIVVWLKENVKGR
jgi:hypothetical protein